MTHCMIFKDGIEAKDHKWPKHPDWVVKPAGSVNIGRS